MSNLDKARETQLRNIQTKTGKTLPEVRALIENSGLKKHGEIRTMLMERLGLGYGDANTLVHAALQSDGQRAAQASEASMEDVLQGIYTGSKAPLRPIHDALMKAIAKLGPFETVVKKGYVSLRRRKQFAMIGPASKGRVEVGLNMKGADAGERLVALPPGGMCQYKVYLTGVDEVDAELMGWLGQAYAGAG
jgi:hypothetical protein